MDLVANNARKKAQQLQPDLIQQHKSAAFLNNHGLNPFFTEQWNRHWYLKEWIMNARLFVGTMSKIHLPWRSFQKKNKFLAEALASVSKLEATYKKKKGLTCAFYCVQGPTNPKEAHKCCFVLSNPLRLLECDLQSAKLTLKL
ncbi:hypothetical protein RFI_00388 [Reticulomyxa filosa]|uniref:Uncharacterized protein n=1 Tax=Reticulomyxa filosa TaxID=46433 RepID=X6PF42_RETFI|nr:hypothetical protein RFI_00388 [Reticulomyxa filosa]|eukprot:ETO36674.1 hypothetical protein RFI_00388 [Reticulomyxa filosa]